MLPLHSKSHVFIYLDRLALALQLGESTNISIVPKWKIKPELATQPRFIIM